MAAVNSSVNGFIYYAIFAADGSTLRCIVRDAVAFKPNRMR